MVISEENKMANLVGAKVWTQWPIVIDSGMFSISLKITGKVVNAEFLSWGVAEGVWLRHDCYPGFQGRFSEFTMEFDRYGLMVVLWVNIHVFWHLQIRNVGLLNRIGLWQSRQPWTLLPSFQNGPFGTSFCLLRRLREVLAAER